ncbi:carboxymuconolactone decarboxylase family protein [Xanthobacter versatilis]|uniref:Alkylhydroperoxidase like protein, AhpD family n=1 Tax=Xanthobacter autotrophicus (strain ATCC BAA-1158 / Py2) TaxID=78245 RepID=A7IDX8_XANP2|nr:alkylhydroperoxidase like protein, AhpD family [Xanthobacter autotrophicus Py2]
MSRIPALDPATATGKAKDLLAAVAAKFGATPNLFKVAARSPASLEALIGLSGALGGGALPAKIRESLAIAVAEVNGCDYCLSAHSLIGKGAGLSDADISQARSGRATDGKAEAALAFARAVVASRGKVSDGDLSQARQAGLGDGDIVEIVAHVAMNIFTNYLNNVAETEIDFPVVRSGAPRAA